MCFQDQAAFILELDQRESDVYIFSKFCMTTTLSTYNVTKILSAYFAYLTSQWKKQNHYYYREIVFARDLATQPHVKYFVVKKFFFQ